MTTCGKATGVEAKVPFRAQKETAALEYGDTATSSEWKSLIENDVDLKKFKPKRQIADE